MAMLYSHLIGNQLYNTMVFKMHVGYLARDIPAFVMCVCGESGSSLLVESTDSMIEQQATAAIAMLCY